MRINCFKEVLYMSTIESRLDSIKGAIAVYR